MKIQYDELYEQQGGVCAICKKNISKTNLKADLVNGKIRGLLCHTCNKALETLNNDLGYVRSCMSYLMKYDERRSWDEYFLDIAELISTRSKDPSTKVGAVIVRDKVILSTGYNGFVRGVNDNIPERYNRPEKYLWTIHAEENAILNAARCGTKLGGSTLYIYPMHPCSKCASFIAQAEIKDVVIRNTVENPRFADSFKKASEIFNACKILVRKPE